MDLFNLSAKIKKIRESKYEGLILFLILEGIIIILSTLLLMIGIFPPPFLKSGVGYPTYSGYVFDFGLFIIDADMIPIMTWDEFFISPFFYIFTEMGKFSFIFTGVFLTLIFYQILKQIRSRVPIHDSVPERVGISSNGASEFRTHPSPVYSPKLKFYFGFLLVFGIQTLLLYFLTGG